MVKKFYPSLCFHSQRQDICSTGCEIKQELEAIDAERKADLGMESICPWYNSSTWHEHYHRMLCKQFLSVDALQAKFFSTW